jgi:hypothetical protein
MTVLDYLQEFTSKCLDFGTNIIIPTRSIPMLTSTFNIIFRKLFGYYYKYLIYNFYFESGNDLDSTTMVLYNMAGRMYSVQTPSDNASDNYNSLTLTGDTFRVWQTPPMASPPNDPSTLYANDLILCEPSQNKYSKTSACAGNIYCLF